MHAALSEVAHAPGPRSVLVLLAARAFSDGALDLVYVVVAVEVLHGTSVDAGWLYTMFGAGALMGAAASVFLVGRRSLWPAALTGATVTVVALIALGAVHSGIVAAAVFVVIGSGSALLLIASRTLLQRVTDLHLLCHAFSLAEASDTTMLMFGSLSVPLIVAVLSPRWVGAGIALVLAGVVCSQIGAIARADRQANAPIAIIEMLRHSDIFGLLSAPALETLAREARPLAAPAGTVIITEGDRGDDFYVVQSGEVAIAHDGRVLRTCRRGHGFGELALLFDVPRTATVTATEDSELLAIGREAFLVSVTGEQATVHNLAAHIDALDHSLGAWPGPETRDQR